MPVTGPKRVSILDEAIAAFKRGCGSAAPTDKCLEAVNAHYEAILDDPKNTDIEDCFDEQNLKWKDAIATVEKTGEQAVQNAGARSTTSVSADDFTSAAKTVETQKKLTTNGSDWC